MAESEDLINFDIIETQKENIQALPGGRSAKQLSLLCSPLLTSRDKTAKDVSLTQTQELKALIRADFEKELSTIADADDPLDIFDRYIKWTCDAYPSAQATSESGLLQLLERATKQFLGAGMFKNDPRYLKMWLLYVKLFADEPRETYGFLARHGIGEQLALFYEEYAAWLEAKAHWIQAEEVFAAGLDRQARPTERLLRKFAEFQHRRDEKGSTDEGPDSPALPLVRPALAAKADPFEHDPQARDRAAAAASQSSKPAAPRKKLAIFADGEEASRSSSSASERQPEHIGSLTERRKENTREARPWAGETLDGGKKAAGPKMSIFRDPVS
jgi:checkpoint serine/threonine-protein kinase